MHFADRPHRLAEVLECGTTIDEIKGTRFERHRRRVAVPKIDQDARPLRILRRDADKRRADVQSGDMIGAELRQFDGKVAWAGCDLKHITPIRQLCGDALGCSSELEDGLLFPRVPRVPASQESREW